MNSELSWDSICDTFHAALDVPATEREAWLDATCAGREELRREVAEMLRANEPDAQLEIERRLSGDSDPILAEGTRLGSYRIIRLLGRGGMGEVYLCARQDAGFDQLVAIKVLRHGLAGPEAAARFRRERRILAHLAHPAIVPLLDSGLATDGRPYLVLQFVEGLPITRYCDEHKLSVEARLRLFVAVCRVVQYAHSRLIIHRDLKPSNILVTAEGEVRLLDFGIAKALASENEETEVTSMQPAPMTRERAAPEQLRGDMPSTSTDVWTLGVLLYELLTGKLPFDVVGRSREQIERAITLDATPTPSDAIRGDLETVVATALRRQPELRYGSSGQLGDDVERVLARQPILARPHSLAYRMRRFVARNRAAVGAGSLALVLLIAFSVVTLIQSAAVKRERDRATREEVKANAVVDLLTQVLEGSDPNGAASSPALDVNELLARGENRAAELSNQAAVQARLWHVLGKVHLARSDLVKGRRLLARAHARQVAIGGVDDPNAMDVAVDLARADAMLGFRSRAATRLRTVIAHVERQSPLPAALLARALEALSEVSDRNRQTDLLLRALALRRQLIPPNPILVAQSLNQLGVVTAENGDSAAAERYYREALALLEHSLPADHPDTLSVRSNLALTVADLSERKALFRDLVAAYARRYGEQSTPVATAWTNFGATVAELGDFRTAMAALAEARERWRRIVGPNHAETINARRSIAAILELERRPQESLAEMHDILAAAAHTDINPMMLASLRAQEAGVLFRLGRLTESKREMESAYSDLCRLEPEGADDRTDVQFWIGRLLLADNKPDDADVLLSEVVAARSKTFPAGHPRIAEAQAALGRARIARGSISEGRALISSALESYSRYPLAHPDDVDAARRALTAAR